MAEHPRGVSSRRHPVVTAVLALRRGGPGRADGACLAEGPHLAEEGLAAGWLPVLICATPRAARRHASLVRILERALPEPARHPQDLPRGLWSLSDAVFAAISATVAPQGLAVVFVPPATRTPARPPLVLALDGVQDPGNVGTLARALLAFGGAGSALLLGPGSADPMGDKALRASAGAAFRLRLERVHDLADSLRGLAAQGQRLWALVPHGGVPLSEAPLAGSTVLVVGGEGQGVSPAVRSVCAGLSIPMPGPIESLNAAQAGTLALYAFCQATRSH